MVRSKRAHFDVYILAAIRLFRFLFTFSKLIKDV